MLADFIALAVVDCTAAAMILIWMQSPEGSTAFADHASTSIDSVSEFELVDVFVTDPLVDGRALLTPVNSISLQSLARRNKKSQFVRL